MSGCHFVMKCFLFLIYQIYSELLVYPIRLGGSIIAGFDVLLVVKDDEISYLMGMKLQVPHEGNIM